MPFSKKKFENKKVLTYSFKTLLNLLYSLKKSHKKAYIKEILFLNLYNKLKEDVMFEIISQILIYFILVALVGGIIGYLICEASCSKKSSSCNEKSKSTNKLHIDQIESNNEVSKPIDNNLDNELKEDIGEEPNLLLEPREGKKDNLQLIKGIGKVSENLLNDIGIYHFEQIANLTKEEVKWLDNSMAFPGRIEREEWVKQAKELSQNSK